jgi:hypothetical protein
MASSVSARSIRISIGTNVLHQQLELDPRVILWSYVLLIQAPVRALQVRKSSVSPEVHVDVELLRSFLPLSRMPDCTCTVVNTLVSIRMTVSA